MHLLRPYGDWDVSTLSQGFRRVIPVDARYVSITRQPHPTETALGADDMTCIFRFLPIADIYMFNDCKLAMEVRLVTKREPRAAPRAGSMVGPVNNTMSSLIRRVIVSINGKPGKLTCDWQ